MALPVHSLTQSIGFGIAPGIVLQRDVLDPMELAPLVATSHGRQGPRELSGRGRLIPLHF
jgi:hypothetical protein